jgi:hypothetical protein
VFQRVGSTKASGASADDGDIDFGEQGMLTKTLIKQAYLNPAASAVLPPSNTTDNRSLLQTARAVIQAGTTYGEQSSWEGRGEIP